MSYPELNDWKATSWALHQAAMLLGPIHNTLLMKRRNYLHLPLFVESTGLVSQTLPKGGRIRINFKDAAVFYVRGSGEVVRFDLSDHTQSSLFQALLDAMRVDEYTEFLADADENHLAKALVDKLHANRDQTAFIQLNEVSHTDPLSVNGETASAYADVLYSVYTATARFRARLEGHMSPIVVWPEHFDLSTLWFVPDNPEMDEHKAHLNFGFTPYTPDQYEFPYLYAYVYPFPEPFEAPELPKPAFWNPEGWRGVVVNYADLKDEDDPAQFVEQLFSEVYEILSRLIGQ